MALFDLNLAKQERGKEQYQGKNECLPVVAALKQRLMTWIIFCNLAFG
jgi:hypothetical protein